MLVFCQRAQFKSNWSEYWSNHKSDLDMDEHMIEKVIGASGFEIERGAHAPMTTFYHIYALLTFQILLYMSEAQYYL